MINKLCNLIGRIPKDKILHYFISYLIFDLSLSICSHFNLINWITISISTIIVSFAIFIKETIDKKTTGWSWSDIVAGYLGTITKLGFFLIETL